MGRRRKPGALSERALSGAASTSIHAAGRTPRRRAIFTIVSCNYIAYAVTLMQSVREFHPEADRFIVLADSYREFPGLDAAAELIFCDEIGIELISNMQLWYSVIEFNTAIKPFVFRHLFDRFAYDEVVYLDPDILLFRPMAEVFDGLGAHNIVLIPHIMEPLQDGKEPSDLSIMKSGVYNLGFLGVRNDPEARALIAWWGERCYLHCRVDVAGHMFTDQRWMDLAPTFVPNPLILRHPGYNVAYWNLAHRRIEQDGDGTWLVNGGPLVFFHFSGISPEDPTVFSKHQNRFTAETLGPVSALCELYRRRVIANGWEKYSRLRYGFAAFPNGRPIEDAMRQWLRRAVDNGRMDAMSRVVAEPHFFDQPDEEAAEKGVTVTRFMYEFWLNRRDLQEAFDIFTPRGSSGYLEWFLNGEARSQGVDGRSIAAARRIRNEPEARPASVDDVAPPWPSVSRSAWQGPAREAARFLEGDVTAQLDAKRILVPVQVALSWELRSDLREHFRLETADNLYRFLGWALTSGVEEGVVDCQEFSPQFLEQMAHELSTSSYYSDVPITAGLVATRFVESDNKCYDPRRRFPVERAGRLAHGLWFAYVAARRFNWPQPLVAPLRAHFEAPGDVEVDGLRLTNAMLAIWSLRDDVQKIFALDTDVSVRSYVVWLLTFGLREMEISVDQLGDGLQSYLRSESPWQPLLERVLDLHETRADLQQQFDITTAAGRAALRTWWWNNATGSHDKSAAAAHSSLTNVTETEQGRPTYTAKVALTGQWSAPTGRGEDVRCSAVSLQMAGFSDFLIIDSDTHQVLRPDGSVLSTSCEVQVEINILHLNADTAYADWRLMQRLRVFAKTSIGFWAWELERLPGFWRHSFSFFDEIWASTRFAKAAFSREQLRPVRLMPMAVFVPETQRECGRRELGLPADATVFLFVFHFGSFISRKNPEAVVRAFLQAFPSGNEQVFLVIKTMGAEDNYERHEQLRELCTDPRISLRDIRMARDELIGLIKASDAFVSLHRSEGFGRGPAEAMLLGRPTILTAYSGTSDFATSKCAYLVDHALVPVLAGEYIGVDGQNWADANVATAARHMRTIYEQPESARRIGKRGKAEIARLLNPSVVGQAMHARLSKLLSHMDQGQMEAKLSRPYSNEAELAASREIRLVDNRRRRLRQKVLV